MKEYTKEEVIELCKQAYTDGWSDNYKSQAGLTDIGEPWNQQYIDGDDWCSKNLEK